MFVISLGFDHLFGNPGASEEDFQSGMPRTADVIYAAMEQSAEQEPDVLAQGCRALGALCDLKPGEKMKVNSNLQWNKLNNAIMKTVIGS